MAITGNLRTMQLSELLQWLSMGQKTGTLVVTGHPGEKRIFFQAGRILSSSSTIEREYLGHFLVAYGYITEEELTKAMEVQHESKILLGKILVMIGAIQESELADLIRLKASETIYDIFLWTEGAFEFIDGALPQMPMIPISADVTGIVMEGLRRYDEWQRIRTRVKTAREIPAVVAPIDVESLPERERLILVAIDGVRPIAEIAEATHNPEFFIARFVYELLEAGQAELVGSAPEEILEPVPDDPNEAVFEEAAASPFDGGAARPEALAIEPPEPRTAPPPRDVAQFLRRTSDSSASQRRPQVRSGAGDQSGERLRAVPSTTLTPPPAKKTPEPATSVKRDSYPDIPLTPSTAMIPPNAVPTLKISMEDLTSWTFTPNEAFIVSRINGLWDVKSIVKISPFPEIEVLRVFIRLHEGGVISWG